MRENLQRLLKKNEMADYSFSIFTRCDQSAQFAKDGVYRFKGIEYTQMLSVGGCYGCMKSAVSLRLDSGSKLIFPSIEKK
ncbi:hypothetical protein CW304_27855 [Bacillus sp. UFRGS-B20]|nr:hypothetical protein CW304_27855 [Bacillus sp. UFRGS-B20]